MPASTISGAIAEKIATGSQLMVMLRTISGSLFVAALPQRAAVGAYEKLVGRRRDNLVDRLESDPVVRRMQALLGEHLTDEEILSGAQQFYEGRRENRWGRWQSNVRTNWHVKTEVDGLEHLHSALNSGGAVLWGMSFCGTLFSKIALWRAGVSLAQLSTADHGAGHPRNWMSKKVLGPLYCFPEGRYLTERVQIPDDGGSDYLFRIGEILRSNGCIWITGERDRVKKALKAEVLGHEGHFPIGAPMLASRNNATLLPTSTQRVGPFHYLVTIESPIAMDGPARIKEKIDSAVQEYASRLEVQILKSPGSWDWDFSWVRNLTNDGF